MGFWCCRIFQASACRVGEGLGLRMTKRFRVLPLPSRKTLWFLVGNGGMGHGDYYRGPYGTIIGIHSPHSLLRTREKSVPTTPCDLGPWGLRVKHRLGFRGSRMRVCG